MSFLKITQCVAAENYTFSVTRNSLIAVSIQSNLRSFIIVWQIIWIRNFWRWQNQCLHVFSFKKGFNLCHKTFKLFVKYRCHFRFMKFHRYILLIVIHNWYYMNFIYVENFNCEAQTANVLTNFKFQVDIGLGYCMTVYFAWMCNCTNTYYCLSRAEIAR